MNTKLLNFGGFYGYIHNELIDNMIENYFYEDLENDINFLNTIEIDYKYLYNEYSRRYLDLFVEWLHDEGFGNINLKYVSLVSPTYYNYTTDKIEYTISKKDSKVIIKELKKDKDFILYLEDVTTSSDVYISFNTFDDVINNNDLLIEYCLNYLVSIFNEKDFYDYYDRNNFYEMLYNLDCSKWIKEGE